MWEDDCADEVIQDDELLGRRPKVDDEEYDAGAGYDAKRAAVAGMTPAAASRETPHAEEKTQQQQRPIPIGAFDAGDVDLWRTYKDVTEYFRQFGFFDSATYDGFIEQVMRPNASWATAAGSGHTRRHLHQQARHR